MDDIHAWVEEHGEDLSAVARQTDLGAGIVHLLAVLVLGGLPDDQILGGLRAHLACRDGREDPLRQVPVAMSEIRELVAGAP